MRIVVLDIAASKTGAESILKDFSAYLKDRADGNEWIFITGVPGIIPAAEKLENPGQLKGEAGIYTLLRSDVKSSWASRLKFEWFTGAGYIRSLKPDRVFSMENTLPNGSPGARTALYVHQPLGFQKTKRFSLFKREERHLAIYQYFISKLIDSSIRRADKVIVQTHWMREAVLEKLKVPAEKVCAILPPLPEAPEGQAGGDFSERHFDEKLFVFPSGPIIYKNHECVIRAAKLLNERGITDFKVIFTLTEEEAGEGLVTLSKATENNIEWRGRLPRKDLFGFYRTGTLIFPSYIETYGYPPAEVRSVGGMVLASDTPFCREVLKGYGNAGYFDPFSPEELAKLMQEVIEKKLSPADRGEDKVPSGSWAEVVEAVTA